MNLINKMREKIALHGNVNNGDLDKQMGEAEDLIEFTPEGTQRYLNLVLIEKIEELEERLEKAERIVAGIYELSKSIDPKLERLLSNV